MGHSLSPLIQNTALAALEVPIVYLAAPLEPSGVEAAVHGLVALQALGTNVTVPYKEVAFALCHRVTPRARAMRACNVLSFAQGEIVGDNTDGVGWWRGLQPILDGARPHRALVLGAGGAARAVVHTLIAQEIPEIVVFNRTPERAEQLVRELPPGRVVAEALERWLRFLEPGCLVVQTTSAGWNGTASSWPLPSSWPEGALLSELLYGRETVLAATVRALGGRVQDGLPMLVYQASESLRIWLGQALSPSLEARLLTLARDHLEARLSAPG